MYHIYNIEMQKNKSFTFAWIACLGPVVLSFLQILKHHFMHEVVDFAPIHPNRY